MGLFDKQPDTRTPAERVAAQLLASARSQADQVARVYMVNYNKMWITPGVDPKDVMTALGVNAGPLFYVTNTIMALAAPDLLKSIPSKYTYAINPDGTITLTDVPQPSSSSSSTPQGDGSSSSSSPAPDLDPVQTVGGS